MKVRDLIEELRQCDPEAIVIAANKVSEGSYIPIATKVFQLDPASPNAPMVKIRTDNWPQIRSDWRHAILGPYNKAWEAIPKA